MDKKSFIVRKKNAKKSDTSANIGCGTGLSGKICRVNNSKLNKSDFVKQFKKSYDWQDQRVTVDAIDQHAAETTVPKELIQHIKTSIGQDDMGKVAFAKGILSLAKTAKGLYSGFFSDNDGQVIEKFEATTLEIMAKNLIVKNLYDSITPTTVNAAPAAQETLADVPKAEAVDPASDIKHDDRVEDMQLISEMTGEVMRQHQEVYHQGQAPFEPINGGKGSVRLKFGNIEIEIKKSIQDFVKNVRNQAEQKEDIRKAISAWRRNVGKQHTDDLTAAKALLETWESNKESFNQIRFAVEQLRKK